MFRSLLRTRPDFACFLARIALGAALLPHGLAKIGITLDGNIDISGGIDRTTQYFQSIGVAPALGYVAIAVEVLGSLALIFGFFGRIAALGVIGLMGVAAWKTMAMQIAGGGAITAEVVKTWWYDNPQIQTTYGAFHILAVAVGLALLIRGSGALSFDRAMSKDPA